MDIIPNSISAPAAPGAISLTAASAAAPGAIPVTSGSAAAPTIVPLPAGTPPAPGTVGIPVITAIGEPMSPIATQAQLSQAVAGLETTIAAGTKPIVTRPDGTKEEITIDNNNTIGVEPVS